MPGERIRIRGTVQGVGFRPTVACIARDQGLGGYVLNDAEGVVLALAGSRAQCDAFLAELARRLPPLARIDAIEREADPALEGTAFEIRDSATGAVRTDVAPDAATCTACLDETLDPEEPRFRYAFTNCTHCGPRFSILESIPYDRRNTSMKAFDMCEACRTQYEDPTDRRYHAQPIACPRCGPLARLERIVGDAVESLAGESGRPVDVAEAMADLVRAGAILAVKGLGCFHLVCDATQPAVVNRLRTRKRRPHKPFALLAPNVEIAAEYVELETDERRALSSAAAPIVLARRRDDAPPLAEEVAPGQPSLGMMLPATPLHHLFMRALATPVVCTSANLTEEPPVIDDAEAMRRLRDVADAFVLHDRPIRNRVEDSIVCRIDGDVRVLRRARGHAPAPVPLPPGFESAPDVLAMGGHLKSAFGMASGGRVVLSPYHGDLDHPEALDSWQATLRLLTRLYDHEPAIVAVDAHPEYAPTRVGDQLARERGRPVERIGHHHAHVAACLVEAGRHRQAPPVLGIAFDGIGMGDDGEPWGGEFLRADYAACQRVGSIDAVAWLGRDRAAREPWRNLYAHLRAAMAWPELEAHFGESAAVKALLAKPRDLLEMAIARPHLAPRISSAGRLFDAVAAAVGLFFEAVDYEGQAAMALEGLVTADELDVARSERRYPVGVSTRPSTDVPYLDWRDMWRAILRDLVEGTCPARIAARFHLALAGGVVTMAERIRRRHDVDVAALSGGVFQNRVLTEEIAAGLRERGWTVLLHRDLPPNDGCLAVGQAAIAAARHLALPPSNGEPVASR